MINKNIIFLGMPGAGKGTVSSKLVELFNIVQLSTGDIFREEIKNQSQLGLKVKQLVESGAYVPDDITNEIVKNKLISLEKNHQKFILDGYPRTIDQAQFLDSINLENYIVIYLQIEERVVIERLSQRFFCNKCKRTFNLTSLKSSKHPYCQYDNELLIQRVDDQPEAIKKRLEVYKEQTQPLINFYQQKNKLIIIEADKNLDILINEIIEVVK